MTTTVLIQSALKPNSSYPECSPLMLHITFDQDWSTGLIDIHVWMCKYIRTLFWRSRARSSKVTGPIRPEFKLVPDFIPVLVTSKFDEDPIKNERATYVAWGHHFPIISIWEILQTLKSTYSKSGPIRPIILVTCKSDEDRITAEGVSVETSCSPL